MIWQFIQEIWQFVYETRQFLTNGLITGILYSLLAIGFALVYNTTRIFHMAAAALYIVAAYAFYFFSRDIKLPIILSAFFAIGITMVMSLAIDKGVYLPLKNKKASLNVVMISSIGVMTILINLIAMLFGNETKIIDSAIQAKYNLGAISITAPQMYQAIVGTTVLLGFFIFIRTSYWGLLFKALSDDDVLFETLGYKIHKTRSIIFLLSGAFIALASCLTVYDIGLNPHMGMIVLINAMVAMIIGGSGRFNTCILGGIFLGVLQAIVDVLDVSNWYNAITFVVLLLFLFWRPQGIAGYKKRTV